VNWADLIAAQGAFGTDFYDRSTRTIGALGSHEIRPILSAPSLGQSIEIKDTQIEISGIFSCVLRLDNTFQVPITQKSPQNKFLCMLTSN